MKFRHFLKAPSRVLGPPYCLTALTKKPCEIHDYGAIIVMISAIIIPLERIAARAGIQSGALNEPVFVCFQRNRNNARSTVAKIPNVRKFTIERRVLKSRNIDANRMRIVAMMVARMAFPSYD